MSDEKIEAPRSIDDDDLRDALDEAAWFAQPSEINDERHDLARAVVALKARLATVEAELDKLKALHSPRPQPRHYFNDDGTPWKPARGNGGY